LAFAVSLLLAPFAASAVGPGDAAPAFALTNLAGETVDLARLRGRVVYVDFWASWCAPCKRSFPWMNTLLERYGREGLSIVAVNVDKRRSDADRFLRDVPAAFTVVFDGQGTVPTAYDVKGMPSSYLVDRRGTVTFVEEGFHEERRTEIEARIRTLLAQQ
jgi:thiol-disulfide isomerase/thioredoxin